MKKILLLASFTAILVSCNKASENEYVITGTVTGVENGKMVILEKPGDMGLVPVDTVKVENGTFKFIGKSTEPEIHLIQVDAVNGKVPFILENGEIKIVVYKDSVNTSKVSGTYNNDELAQFNAAGMKVQKRMMEFQKVNTEKMTKAQQSNDTVVINQLRKEYTGFQKELEGQSNTYIETHPKSFISVLLIEGLFNSPTADVKVIEKYYNTLSSDLKNTKPGKSIKEKLGSATTVEVGKAAPEFSAPNPEGKMVSLKESLGKVTIIDFWASWCGPCRKENPNVVALYNEFHDKGLNIIGVSLDKEGDAAKWKEAIANDKLTWTQVSNLKFWQDPIATQYNVKSIPQMFILDANGVIVGKDLRGEELKNKVKELLAI
ncbi:TlpA disulfide reductase family protein [Flavobacterium sp. '19STA2R22 D10 B1']|uniref:TlpA disulfide reductase family protein n=1 Tax=Flavobacterium aerium TaxID=3037261 RepID=UPI00278C3812|nr:TlpA disulfide reductase family protein [Flavobacterium sp. '19STA2R22 D10 B1']